MKIFNIKRKVLVAGLVVGAALMAGCANTSTATKDTDSAIDSNAIQISFAESQVSAEDPSVEINGTEAKIMTPGTYNVTGACSEGSLVIDKDLKDVTIYLTDLDLAASKTSPVKIGKNSTVTLQVNGTTTLTDYEDPATEPADDSVESDFEGAAIKVKSGASVTISSTDDGELIINSDSCKNGIDGASDSSITLDGENLTTTITAANDGISGNSIEINNGSIAIQSGADGIQANPDLIIHNGVFDIVTAGGHKNASALTDEDSAKGIKANGAITIENGAFDIDSADDSIQANGDISINNGTFALSSGDDGIHSDLNVTIDNASIDIQTCEEGIEGAAIVLNNGTGTIVANDDGINAATDETVEDISVTINGGSWTVNAAGDGIDAGGDTMGNPKGSIYMNDGTVQVYGSENGGNSGIDYDGEFVYAGGSLIVLDTAGMNQYPSEGLYVFFGLNDSTSNFAIGNGSKIEVRDSEGNAITSATGVKSANCVTVCDPAIKDGEEYHLYIDGLEATSAITNTGAEMQFGRGGGMPSGMRGSQDGSMPDFSDSERPEPPQERSESFSTDGERREPPDGFGGRMGRNNATGGEIVEQEETA